MAGNKEKPKIVLEPVLQKLATRDKAIVETPKTTKSHAIPSTSRKTIDQNIETNLAKLRDQRNHSSAMPSSFPNFNATSLQIQVKTTEESKIEKTKTPKENEPLTPTSISLISEASVNVIPSISSIVSSFKNIFKTEDSPSFHHRLVIPFSGFTEADVKEIRGGKEPKSNNTPGNWQYYPSISTSTKDPRSVLKQHQSEKRKDSYERYVKESLERFLQTKNNTEDSSYNTVLAVKMMVDNASIEEIVSSAISDEQTGNNTKDTIYHPNSEVLSARLDRIMNPPNLENPFTQNTQDVPKTQAQMSVSKTDSLDQRIRLMNLRKELEEVDKKYTLIEKEYDGAEKAYYAAKLNFHRMRMKREKLLSELEYLEKELSSGSKTRNKD